MDSKVAEPTFVIRGREGLAPVFADLNHYHATTHFNGQSTVDVVGDHGTGETYCIAHHLTIKDGQRTLMVASLRYLDKFAKQDGTWLFAERKLLVDWTDTRPSTI
jgi:SnoaL-like domain